MKDLEFWSKRRFKNRSIKIDPGGVEIPVPDDVVLCDFCKERITEFPVAVYLGNALCNRCLKQVKKDMEEEQCRE